MKKTVALILVIILSTSMLAACNGGGSSDDPNVGLWKGISVEMLGMVSDIEDVYEKGSTLELKANGNCTAIFDGDRATGKWTGSGSRLTLTIGGINYKVTIEGDALVFELLEDMLVIYTKDGEAPRSRSGGSPTSETPPPADDDKPSPAENTPAAVTDPNAGMWTGSSVEIFDEETPIEEIYAQGATLDLMADGDCVLIVNGDRLTGTWTSSNGGVTVNIGGEIYDSPIEGDALVFPMNAAMIVYFTRDGELRSAYSGPAGTQTPPVSSSTPPGASLSEAIKWWEGNWYGTFFIYDTSPAYSDVDGLFVDVYAVIEVSQDGSAVVYMWTEDEEWGTVRMGIKANGAGLMGTAVSESGELFDDRVAAGHWNIDPSTCRFDNMIEIREVYTDSDGDWIDYEFLLRPWGMDWDDVPAYEHPNYYEWYLSIYQRPMLDVVRDIGEMNHSQVR